MCPAIVWRPLTMNYLAVQAPDGQSAVFDGRENIRLARPLISYVINSSSLLLVFAQGTWVCLTEGCEAHFRLRFQNLQTPQAVSLRYQNEIAVPLIQ